MNAVLLKIFHIVQVNGKIMCNAFWSDPETFSAYFITLVCTNIIAPTVLITAAYSAIFCKLKKQVLILGDSISDQLRQQEYLRQKKIVKMAFAIVCAFAVCWLPIAVLIIIQIYIFYQDLLQYPCWFLIFSEVSTYFLILTSVTNPTICFIFGTRFKEELCKMYRRICCRCCFSRKVDVEPASENKP
jgi:hypothetical protein